MKTPVCAARQCLSSDASKALDDAVAVAKRRGHLQTTSLHAISAFLALPSSFLREACARVRSSAYSPRLQFKALELCFGVALDRLPSSSSSSQTTSDEPPISNSLMAAIKRSQANQRRNPESFHLYQQQLQLQQQQHQQSQSQSTASIVKVELQQLILSILDDPVVSKVFAEAGFQSTEIKLAIVRPAPPLVRYQRSRCPPLFLCNLPGGDSDTGSRRSFSFPFSGFSGVSTVSDGEENCRRIGEILARKKERNPLLVGVGANDAVNCFQEIVESGRSGEFFPVEITGLNFSSMEKEFSEFINGSRNEDLLSSRFEELERLIESCSGPGVLVSFGDLKGFIDGNCVEAGSFLVVQLRKLLDLHSGKLWLMGTAASYETYLKFLTRFPSIEKEWDLQLFPITSSKPSIGGFCSRPQSLMESFVPFGGFFSTPSDMKSPLPSRNQLSRCYQCNEKYEQEVSAILKGGSTFSVADQYQESLPSWLQTAEFSPNKGLNTSKAKDDGAILNAKVNGLQKKWNDICRRLNHSSPVAEPDKCRVDLQVLPRFVGFPFAGDGKDKTDNGSSSRSSSTHASPSKSSCENGFQSMSVGVEKCSVPNKEMLIQLDCDGKDEIVVSKLQVKPSSEPLKTNGPNSPTWPQSNSSNPNCHESSATSVTTDLGLGTLYGSSYKEPKKPLLQAHKERLQDISGCVPSQVHVARPSVSNPSVRSSYCSGPRGSEQYDQTDFKSLWRSLTEKVGRQNEVIHAISETIAWCRTGNERRRGASLRRDIWFSFVGSDRVAKRRVAVALAEIMFGSSQNLICVDLSSHDGITRSNTMFDFQGINGCDMKFRGKTVVDYITGEISKKPLSMVLLENVDKADLLVQSSLTQAIRTGKFSDLHGREIGINNSLFITTSGVIKDSKTISPAKEQVKFSEERILGAQGWQMQILFGHVPEKTTICSTTNISVTSRAFVNKRKLIGNDGSMERLEIFEIAKRVCKKSSKCLDLNLPVQEDIEGENDQEDSANEENSNSISDNTESWLEDFFDQVDKTVVFKPFDFDALAEIILKEINESFRNAFEVEGKLEIDLKVMEQILAAAWLCDSKTAAEDWVEQVVGRSFAEVRQKYGLKSGFSLKLVSCEGIFMEEKVPGICLPAKIIIN